MEYNRLLKEGDSSFPVTIKWSRDLKPEVCHKAAKSKFERMLIFPRFLVAFIIHSS